MGELAPFFSGIVAAVLAYITMRVSTEKRFAAIEAKQAAQDERIAQIREDSHVTRELTVQMAELAGKIDSLRRDVEKHNDVVMRTLKLEQEMRTQWNRVDELRDDLHEIKVGGTR